MTLATDSVSADVVHDRGGHRLRVTTADPAHIGRFVGVTSEVDGGWVLDGELNAVNAMAVRHAFPWLTPRPLGLRTSAGTGDRLGMATPGHVRAFRVHGTGVVPVFAQQSIREMDRVGREPQQVLDDATFGCVRAGWTLPVGADADHLKTTSDLDRCLGAGFTTFTIDPGDHVARVRGRVSASELEALDWDGLEDRPREMLARYAALRLDVDGSALDLGPGDVARAAAKYSGAVLHTVEMYRHLIGRASTPVEVEVSVDETDEPTTLVEHAYLATELKRLGVEWVSFAPRYIGDFEKGIDYRGDVEAFAREFSRNAQIARQLGPYKMSLHSGSDKFSIYDRAVAATEGLIHLKTSGTTYLVALGVVAAVDPELFRAICERSRAAYGGARASYQVSARLERVPYSGELRDEDLPRLLEVPDARQILHVGYSAVIGVDAPDGGEMERALREALAEASGAFDDELENHLGRHLRPFAEGR